MSSLERDVRWYCKRWYPQLSETQTQAAVDRAIRENDLTAGRDVADELAWQQQQIREMAARLRTTENTQ